MYEIVAYDYNVDRWCVDCAREMGIIPENGEEWTGDGGEVFDHHETDTYFHCAAGEDCVNSMPAYEYDGLDGDWLVGQRIEQIVLSVLPYDEVIYRDEVEKIAEDVIVYEPREEVFTNEIFAYRPHDGALIWDVYPVDYDSGLVVDGDSDRDRYPSQLDEEEILSGEWVFYRFKD